jgi:hypothetical protein
MNSQNAVQAIRPSRQVKKVELFDGGIRITLSDGVGIRITYDDARITLLDEEFFTSQQQYHDVELQEVA